MSEKSTSYGEEDEHVASSTGVGDLAREEDGGENERKNDLQHGDVSTGREGARFGLGWPQTPETRTVTCDLVSRSDANAALEAFVQSIVH